MPVFEDIHTLKERMMPAEKPAMCVTVIGGNFRAIYASSVRQIARLAWTQIVKEGSEIDAEFDALPRANGRCTAS